MTVSSTVGSICGDAIERSDEEAGKYGSITSANCKIACLTAFKSSTFASGSLIFSRTTIACSALQSRKW